MKLQEYEGLRIELEKRKAALDQAEGSLAQVLRVLKQDFNVGSIKEAQALLTASKAKETALAAKLERALHAFQAKWGKHLGNETD